MKLQTAEFIAALKQIPAADLVAVIDNARATAEAERHQAEAERLAKAQAADRAATTKMLIAQHKRQIEIEKEQRKAAIDRLKNQPAETEAFVKNLHAIGLKGKDETASNHD